MDPAQTRIHREQVRVDLCSSVVQKSLDATNCSATASVFPSARYVSRTKSVTLDDLSSLVGRIIETLPHATALSLFRYWNSMSLKLAFVSLALLLIPAHLQAQVIDVGPGQTIDSASVVPDGAVINLNGGSIADDTDFTGAGFPNGITLNVNSGTVGLDVDISNSNINIDGGTVALLATDIVEGVNNINNNTITITGGNVGSFFQVRGNSTLELSGGSLEAFGIIGGGATGVVTGGSFNLCDISGPLDISGGDFNTFRVFSGGAVNLFGTDFAIDGVPISDLVLNQQTIITDRNVTLSGTLSDGSTFSNLLDPVTTGLNFDPEFGELLPGVAATSATVTVTLVQGTILGDVNQDGEVDFLDISPFIAILSAGSFLEEADVNQDDVVDFLDISPFIEILAGS